MFYDQTMTFKNIEEIKFTRVAEDTFSISIKSDARFNKEELKDTVFEATLCKLDSEIVLRCGREYTYIRADSGLVYESEYYDIPLNIKLLLNRELNNTFSIRKEK